MTILGECQKVMGYGIDCGVQGNKVVSCVVVAPKVMFHPCFVFFPALCFQELNSEMKQHHEDLDTLEHVVAELSSCGFAAASSPQHHEKVRSLRKDFTQLQKVARER